MNAQIGRLFGLIVVLFALLVVFTTRWTVIDKSSLDNNVLNRLTLIAAGNDARLAELFTRAELKRADCRIDWVSGSDRPALRGAI